MRRLLARVIPCGLVVLALLLAGCTDDRVRPSDTLPPTSSPAPTTEDLPGPDGYPLPPEAQEYTAEGATAFVSYFFDVVNASRASLDSTPIRELSRDCDGCNLIADGFDADLAARYRRAGGELSIAALSDPPLLERRNGVDIANFSVGVTQQARETLDVSGQVVMQFPELLLRGGITIAWIPADSEWLVTSLLLESS